MPGWDALLPRLAETPRENGTAALHDAARWLAETLQAGGVNDVALVEYVARPYGLRLAGVLILAALVLYRRWLRGGRPLAASALAAIVAAVVLIDLDLKVPLFSRIGEQEQHHVVARVPPLEAPARRLILSAHFDTKTDLLDHVERAPIDLATGPVILLLIAGGIAASAVSRASGRGARVLRGIAATAGVVAPLYGVASFAVLSAGALVPARSPGAIDDGAACAVLVRAAEELARAPLARTEVEVILLSAEEVGVQGSWEYARERFATPPELPTFVVNLDPIGVSPDLRFVRRENFAFHGYAPDPGLVELLGEVHERLRGKPLHPTPTGGGTDARSFLAHGIPAATVITESPGHIFVRDLHSARDERERLDETALDATLAFVLEVARTFDRRAP